MSCAARITRCASLVVSITAMRSTVVTSDEDWDSWEDAGALTEPERDQFDGLD